jgi:ABC-type multidrug transport system fused ATPase/permease subunit
VSLLRIIEPTEGSITIDGIDTQSIGITDLRSRLAVIPQEPVMLSGTIRTNLDPYKTSTDAEIWEALRVVHLSEKIKEMPSQLDTPIAGTELFK